MNPGIAYACLSVTIIFNTLLSYLLYHEKISFKMYIGIAIVIGGVIWISLANSTAVDVNTETPEEEELDEKVFTYRLLSIAMAIVNSFLSSLRPIQARWVQVHYGYGPTDFTVDNGLVMGIVVFVLWLYYWLIEGYTGYTWLNTLYSLCASCFITTWGITAMNASVKGLQGPTAAILQTQSIFTITFVAIFLQKIPSLQQFMASLVILIGVAIIILLK